MILLLVAVALKSTAQELNCKFTVNYSQIQGTSTQVFTTLENALMEFINTRRWTQAQYEMNERIRCSMNLTVKEYNEADGRWKCELIVQSTRPVWQSGYQTVVFSFKDTDVAFNYREFDPLQLRDNVIDSNLTAVIAYYAYMIIGLDMDIKRESFSAFSWSLLPPDKPSHDAITAAHTIKTANFFIRFCFTLVNEVI